MSCPQGSDIYLLTFMIEVAEKYFYSHDISYSGVGPSTYSTTRTTNLALPTHREYYHTDIAPARIPV